MKFLFVVQGEGRGHLTQAIAMQDMLIKNGHEVVGVLVGKSNYRELPGFFSKNIHAPIERFYSPNFLPAAKNKRINIWKSVLYNLSKIAVYIRSILFIRKQIKEKEADVVINFYELLLGLTYALLPPKVPYICVAHQYIFLHPDFKFPHGRKAEIEGLKFFTKITCINASKLLALSMHKMSHYSELNISVVPPLLRKEVLDIHPETGNYIHGYMLNETYAEQIIQFQEAYPDVPLHFFWDKKDTEEITSINEFLSFHKLNDKLFLQYMAGCKAYATTAGFESVCEAMLLDKPIMMVPTHIEQECNAHDASLHGAGIVSQHFDLESLLNLIPHYKPNPDFRSWVKQSEWYMMREFDFKTEELWETRLRYSYIFRFS
ncbi:glycosyl transferase [Bacteroidia bacterium]|nr:glycosyl transferase [Bacteroidia bacterium]GHT70603.1 glycosyl transferase [Bacteroidia bacterium]GHU91857.1 glycosyl transferase [Bacteroidia bacterium]